MSMSTNAAAGSANHTRSGRWTSLLESRVFTQVLLIFCTVAAGVLARLQSLAALGVPRLIGVIAITLAAVSALYMLSYAVAKRVLVAHRGRQMDATVEGLIRHYRRLLDESTLNPHRPHP
jgi:cobalamin biosynthesis protein CobD/CbiB